jgi:serine/threonine-protein phosphatase 4 regulatory subunit 2
MDNPEEVMQILERFNVQKNPEINPILEEYLQFVARTGDSVYAWALVKNLFREKLINVITDFHNEAPVKGEIENFQFDNIQLI